MVKRRACDTHAGLGEVLEVTRHNNKMDMTIAEQVEAVKEQICRDYCKHTEEYLSCYKDPDEAEEKLLADMCNFCPLSRL